MNPLYRAMIIGWMMILAGEGQDWIWESQQMSEEDDVRLGAYLFLAWALDHGWEP